MTDPEWKMMTDWSGLPDVYVTKAECQQGMFWRIEACSVPMAIGPEARLIRADRVAALIREAEARGMERAAKEARETDYPWASPTNEQADACDQMAERIAGWLERCAAALRGEKEPK